MYTLAQLNTIDKTQFVDRLGGIFEHSPWIAERALQSRPFSSVQQLHEAMVKTVENSSMQEKLQLIKKHPNLGDRVEMSDDSIVEQKGAGLKDLTLEEYDQFITMNESYMDKFGFPFILAVRGKDKQEIYEAMASRIHHSKETEFQTALLEIYKIAFLRLKEKIFNS